MASSINCPSCSAVVRGLICEHCGRLPANIGSAAEESRALDEFHQLLQKLAPELKSQEALQKDATAQTDETEAEEQRQEKVKHLLRTGFIPDYKEVLIEAGVYCIPYLDSEYPGDAARSRLESITTKLKLIPQDQQTRLAVEEFQAKIKEHKAHRKRDDLIYGGGCFFLLAVCIIALVWLLSKC